MSTLQAWHETRLALLCLVLWSDDQSPIDAELQRCALRGTLPQFFLHAQAADAVHALLPLVSAKGEDALAGARLEGSMSIVRLGGPEILLELLRVVCKLAGEMLADGADSGETSFLL